jgi:hypothetical protein
MCRGEVGARTNPDCDDFDTGARDPGHGNESRGMWHHAVRDWGSGRQLVQQLPPKAVVRLETKAGIGDVTHEGDTILRPGKLADGFDIVARRTQHGRTNPNRVGGIGKHRRQQGNGQFFVAELRFGDIGSTDEIGTPVMPAAARNAETFQQSSRTQAEPRCFRQQRRFAHGCAQLFGQRQRFHCAGSLPQPDWRVNPLPNFLRGALVA